MTGVSVDRVRDADSRDATAILPSASRERPVPVFSGDFRVFEGPKNTTGTGVIDSGAMDSRAGRFVRRHTRTTGCARVSQ